MVGDIVHLNINGLKCLTSPNYQPKIDKISNILESTNATWIFSIQETHLDNDSGDPKFVELYKHIYHFFRTNASVLDPAAGIILCVKRSMELLGQEILEDGRLLYIKVKTQQMRS